MSSPASLILFFKIVSPIAEEPIPASHAKIIRLGILLTTAAGACFTLSDLLLLHLSDCLLGFFKGSIVLVAHIGPFDNKRRNHERHNRADQNAKQNRQQDRLLGSLYFCDNASGRRRRHQAGSRDDECEICRHAAENHGNQEQRIHHMYGK